MATIANLVEAWRSMSPGSWAQDAYGWITEDGLPIRLAAWQQLILAEYWQRRADVSTLFVSAPKKAGKTLLNSLLTCYRWLTMPGTHFTLGNDFDQGSLLQGQMIGAMCKRHPILRRYVKPTKGELLFQPTGSRLITLPSDYAGSSGHNFLTVSFTEVWAFALESHVRLYEELTPPPLTGALRVVDSYAGFVHESELLERVWKRGESGQQIGDSLYLTGQQLSYIAIDEAGHKATWRGSEAERQAYLTEQSETLRPGTFQRLHLNRWQQPIEESFVTEIQWQSCYDPAVKRLAPGDRTPLVLSLDLSRGTLGGDHIGLVAVAKWGSDGFGVKFVQNWIPTTGERWDFDATVGPVIDWLLSNFVVAQLCYDEFEASHFLKQFEGKVWLKPFSQQNERDLSDSFLHQTIISRRLHHYGDESLTKHILLAAAGIKGESKLRLVKSNARRKIDLAVALSMGIYRCNGLNLSSDQASIGRQNGHNLSSDIALPVSNAPVISLTESPVSVHYLGGMHGFTLNGQTIEYDTVLQMPAAQFEYLRSHYPKNWWVRL